MGICITSCSWGERSWHTCGRPSVDSSSKSRSATRDSTPPRRDGHCTEHKLPPFTHASPHLRWLVMAPALRRCSDSLRQLFQLRARDLICRAMVLRTFGSHRTRSNGCCCKPTQHAVSACPQPISRMAQGESHARVKHQLNRARWRAAELQDRATIRADTVAYKRFRVRPCTQEALPNPHADCLTMHSW